MISVSVLVALGSNNLIRRRPVADIMRDLRRFKALVLGIARGTSQGTPTLRCAPHRTKYKRNDHEPRVDLSREFVELTSRIVDFITRARPTTQTFDLRHNSTDLAAM